MDAHHCDVLVVGAGPVGLAAAAELRRRGVDVRCVDAAAHHNVSTKALGLQARTLELFERLG
ncbi:MAG TPA: FAD-dependent oxidoreductase [Mycobacterium sp.]